MNIAYIGELVELRARARRLDLAAYLPPVDRTLTGLEEPLRLSVVSAFTSAGTGSNVLA